MLLDWAGILRACPPDRCLQVWDNQTRSIGAISPRRRPTPAMSARRSLRLPILLAIVMIALLVVLTVGWVLLNVSGRLQDERSSGLYWALLTIGSLFIVLLVVGMVLYLILSIKAINLTRRQSNFIDSVTHELKSPIASMKLYLQTLSRHQVEPDRAGRLLPLHARRPGAARPPDQPDARRRPAGRRAPADGPGRRRVGAVCCASARRRSA